VTNSVESVNVRVGYWLRGTHKMSKYIVCVLFEKAHS